MKYSRIKIDYDSCPESPMEWDQPCTYYAWHRRYSLGNANLKHYDTPSSVIQNLADEYCHDKYREADDPTDEDCMEMLREVAYVFDWHMYDHGDVAFSCGGFSDPFDSGQLGFVFITHAKAKENWPSLADKPDELAKRVEEHVESTLDDYADYVNGHVFCFEVETLERDETVYELVDGHEEEEVDAGNDYLDWEHSDSCCGFIGDDVDGIAGHTSLPREVVQEAYYNVGQWVLFKHEAASV